MEPVLCLEGLTHEIMAARYHSLIADPGSLPKELEVTARDCEAGEIMAVQHKAYPVYGLQFHPESILTPDGRKILKNFLEIGELEQDRKGYLYDCRTRFITW